MKLENPDNIYDWGTEQLYNALLEIIHKSGRYKKELSKVKRGINIEIPIYYIIDGVVDLDYKNNEANIPHFGCFKMEDYKQEIENRNTLMRSIIAEELDDPDMLESD